MDAFNQDEFYMRIALQEAQRAADAGEVPCGAVIVLDHQIIGKAHNQTEMLKDPTAHAEMLAITQATEAVNNWRLNEATLYVTKEPCVMCAGALILSRIKRVVWGLSDPLRGGSSKFNILDQSDLNHAVEKVSGCLETPCKDIIQHFFKNRRAEHSE
jgi:tRNA(adenine34) deaminase